MVFLPFLLKATESNPFSLYQKNTVSIEINLFTIHQKMLEVEKNMQNLSEKQREVLKLETLHNAVSSVFQRRRSMLMVTMQALVEHAFSHAVLFRKTIKGIVWPDWICMRVVPLDRP
jgi:hypothetical protein